MGAYLRVFSESYPMNTNITGSDGFQKSLHPSALDESSLSIEMVNPFLPVAAKMSVFLIIFCYQVILDKLLKERC